MGREVLWKENFIKNRGNEKKNLTRAGRARGGDTCEVEEEDGEEKARRLKEEERLCLAILFFLLILAPRALVTAATRSRVDPEARIGSDPKRVLLSPFAVTPSTPAMKARASFFSWTTTPWSIIIRVSLSKKRKSNWWYWSNLNKQKKQKKGKRPAGSCICFRFQWETAVTLIETTGEGRSAITKWGSWV